MADNERQEEILAALLPDNAPPLSELQKARLLEAYAVVNVPHGHAAVRGQGWLGRVVEATIREAGEN